MSKASVQDANASWNSVVGCMLHGLTCGNYSGQKKDRVKSLQRVRSNIALYNL